MARDGTGRGGGSGDVEPTWKQSQRAADIAAALERKAPKEDKKK